MRIGACETGKRVAVVAEIGNNHEGDPEVAARLIRLMAEHGADAVKLQVYRTEQFVNPADTERFARMRAFELSAEAVRSLAALARDVGVGFVATPLDLESLALIAPLVDAIKIASGDITFVPLLRAAAATGRPIILSTGASTLDEIERALAIIREARAEGADEALAVLHCVSCYPTPEEQANLRAIPFLSQRLGITVGYSDHVLGLDAAAAAVALGARIIEKHVTLDRGWSSYRDHQLSLEPAEVGDLVARIRGISSMLGSPAKPVQACEQSMTAAIRRSVSAARDLPAGHRLTTGDLQWFRPAGGIAPGNEAAMIGRTLERAVPAGHALRAEDLSS